MNALWLFTQKTMSNVLRPTIDQLLDICEDEEADVPCRERSLKALHLDTMKMRIEQRERYKKLMPEENPHDFKHED